MNGQSCYKNVYCMTIELSAIISLRDPHTHTRARTHIITCHWICFTATGVRWQLRLKINENMRYLVVDATLQTIETSHYVRNNVIDRIILLYNRWQSSRRYVRRCSILTMLYRMEVLSSPIFYYYYYYYYLFNRNHKTHIAHYIHTQI